MHDVITLNSKIVKLEKATKKSMNTREAIMYVHTIDEENANGLTFTLAATEDYKDTLINKPVVVKMDTSETDFKGHEPVYDANGNIVKLDTIPIGTITEAWIEDRVVDGETKKALMCKATIWSYKFPTAIEIMQELYDNGNLDTSVEVAIFSYTDDSEPNHRKTVEIEYLGNCLLGSLILPADSSAGVVEMFYKEVAQALQESKPGDKPDLNTSNIQNGGVLMISMEEIKDQLRALLNPNDNSDGGWKMDYYTWDMFTYEDHCVVRSAEDGMYYRFNYEVKDEATVILSSERKLQLHQFMDAPEGEQVEVNGLFIKYKEIESKINELSTSLTEKETEIANLITEKETLTKTNEDLTTEVSQLKDDVKVKNEALTLSSQESNEKIIKLGEVVDSLKDEIASLAPIKDEYEKVQAELQEKELQRQRDELKKYALNSKRITEQELAENTEIAEAIQNVDKTAIDKVIAERVVASEVKNIETNSQNTDVSIQIDINGKDLLPQSTKSEMYAPRKK